MVASSKLESLAVRFAAYLEELHDFFASRGVPFGAPKDLAPFLEHLREPSFHEEMVSMVRSILYREEGLPRTELMEILAVAVGGPQVEEATQNLPNALRSLLTFVTEVSRSQRAAMFAEAVPGVSAIEADATPPSMTTHQPQLTEPPQVPRQTPAPVLADEITASHVLATEPPHPHLTLTNDKLSQSLLRMDAPELHHAATSTPAEAISSRDVPHERASAATPSRTSLLSILRRSYWIPGVLMLALAVIAAIVFNTHTARQPVPAAPATPTIAATKLAKPSAYGPTLHGRSSAANQSGNLITGRPAESSPGTSAEATDTFIAGAPPPSAALPERRQAPDTLHLPHAGSLARNAGAPYSLRSFPNTREGVFLASSGAMASHLLAAPAPGYPKLASLTRTEGQVIVQVVVGRDGLVEATRVLEGPRLLRGAAEHAIRRWRYRPYLVDGRPTDVATIVTVNFRLHP